MPIKPHNFEAGDMKTFMRSVADEAGNSLECALRARKVTHGDNSV